MADAPIPSDANINTKRESVEVITGDGQNMAGGNNLSSIFDKVEAGQTIDSAITNTMDKTPAPKAKEPAPEPKEEVKPKEEAPAPEDDQKPSKDLDEAFTRQEDAQKPQPKADDSEVAEEELAVLPQDKPKTAKRIAALLTKLAKAESVTTETRKEAEDKAKRVAELESKLSEVKTVDPVVEEQVKAKLDELAQFRRRYELDKDPEVQTRYDSKINGAAEQVDKLLAAKGAGEGLRSLIKEEGGWEKFADSSRLVPLAGEDEPIKASDLAKRIMKSLSYTEQREVDRIINESLQAKKDKERYFEEETKKASEFFSKREETEKATREAQQKTMTENQKYVDDYHAKIIKENDFIRERPIPSDATPAQRSAIEDDNKWARQTQAEHKKYMNARTLPDIMGVVDDAVKYHGERHKVAKLTAQLAAAKAEIDTIRSSGRTVGKSGSLAGGGAPVEVKEKSKAPKSLEDAFSRLEDGEKLDE